MTARSLTVEPPGLEVYAVVFGAAALACFAGVLRARAIEDDDTRRGLVALLVTSGAWAAAHVGFVAAPTPAVSVLFYYAGLVVGFATLGPWLYFCSAYTGRTLHRARPVQWLAVGVYLAVVAVKLTNPIHGLYFRWEVVSSPFVHVLVENLALHWLAMGLAYALATVGYFMLGELFWQVDHGATPLLALVGVTGLPVVLGIVGEQSPFLLDMTYEPLGVAAFSVGVLFLFLEDLQTIQLTSQREEPVIVFDNDDRVREFNRAAGELFPGLAAGTSFEDVIPEVGRHGDDEEAVLEVERTGGLRYYQLSTNAFSTNASRLGRVVMLTDITDREEYRTELERQNERLEQFASMVSHDLRNPLNVAQGRLREARRDHDDGALAAASNSLARMERLIDDLLTLARQGQPISEPEPVDLAAVAEDAWAVVDTGAATVTGADDATVEADRDRLQQLFENLFRNAVEHGRDDVAITVGTLDGEGFYVADDGPGIPADERQDVFASGYTTAEEGTGFGLAIVSEVVEAHGWTIAVTEGEQGGARFEIRGVRFLDDSEGLF
jgi:signal transduction histidine kinase